MKELHVTIIDPIGLHARPASFITAEASKYKCDILITNDRSNRTANLKSLMNVLTLGVKKGDSVTIKFNGDDEEIAAASIEKSLVENKISE
ncbi:HPr family phosphocarrier protein [Mycoplasma tauri]|uniref:Phosphocarrier protein HPr n=1 Tax=Mycoplasma tauri TaxID=547987 RepID=A0A953NCH0_9MOLU|nr:HPr family phosphocarrier protein [Mycoplasma tauri]MBZ4195327.1 HPr family phosphocarrier protein [Mycoplasma tauri]MBZ4204052.1 HPr family phosphocarrier protein [Mycoplasma tauri]MBZ4212887.1 HPr family phosphocarrier protein [Mycoplasma tauri]MBZ4218299.1 HPr family phosphocarrier protein [Mycoplasma tauri]MBZ4226665.1 HPr family phosphocarrier protein [Mycoplasma tauri]